MLKSVNAAFSNTFKSGLFYIIKRIKVNPSINQVYFLGHREPHPWTFNIFNCWHAFQGAGEERADLWRLRVSFVFKAA